MKSVSKYMLFIDNVNDMLPEQQDCFVQINPITGISEKDAEKVIAILNN